MPTTAMSAPVPNDGAVRRRLLGSALALCAGPMLPLAAGARAIVPPTSFYANFDGARLLDQDGLVFTPTRLVGRKVLVNFVFTSCSTVCPVQTAGLVGLQRQLPSALRPRIHLLSVSLDPLSDTPKTLKAFAQRMGADLSGWSFVSGRPRDIERLSDALRLFRPGPEVRKPDDHSTALWLIDEAGAVRMRYSGNPPDVQRLLREIATLDQMENSTKAPRPWSVSAARQQQARS